MRKLTIITLTDSRFHTEREAREVSEVTVQISANNYVLIIMLIAKIEQQILVQASTLRDRTYLLIGSAFRTDMYLVLTERQKTLHAKMTVSPLMATITLPCQ